MHWNTVTPLLREVLTATMASSIFDPFRLVGGTALSLQLGHRESVDIDLFTDAGYDSIDFGPIGQFFHDCYPYCAGNEGLPVGLGSSWFVGKSEEEAVKVDVYYTDPFIQPVIEKDSIRLATAEDIIGMKLEILGRGGRKKDFWDLHALQEQFSLQQMIALHQERYPYSHTPEELWAAFVNFDVAEDDFDPVCLLGKQWPLIKLDFVEWVDGS